jgi:hypothetical protein
MASGNHISAEQTTGAEADDRGRAVVGRRAPMRRRPAVRRAAWAPLVALAVVLAGCGSKSVSSDQLHAQATRICSLASSRTARIPSPGSPSASAAFLERGVAVLGPELKGLRSLRAPSDAADVYTATVGMFARKLDELERAAREISRGRDPVNAMRSLQRRLRPLESQEDGGWDALQLPACLNR